MKRVLAGCLLSVLSMQSQAAVKVVFHEMHFTEPCSFPGNFVNCGVVRQVDCEVTEESATITTTSMTPDYLPMSVVIEEKNVKSLMLPSLAGIARNQARDYGYEEFGNQATAAAPTYLKKISLAADGAESEMVIATELGFGASGFYTKRGAENASALRVLADSIANLCNKKHN